MGCGSSTRVQALEDENCKFREQLEIAAKAAELRAAADEQVLAQRAAQAVALVSEHEAERARIKAQLERGVEEADRRVADLEAEKLQLQQRRATSKRASTRQHEVLEGENQILRESLASDKRVAEARLAALVVEKALLTAEKGRCEDSALARIRALEIENTALQRDISGHLHEATSAEAMLRADIESVRQAAETREEGLQTEITRLAAELELGKEAAAKASEANLIAHQAEMSQLRAEMGKRIKDLNAKINEQDAAADILQRRNAQLMTDRAATAERESAAKRAVMFKGSGPNSLSSSALTMALSSDMEL